MKLQVILKAQRDFYFHPRLKRLGVALGAIPVLDTIIKAIALIDKLAYELLLVLKLRFKQLKLSIVWQWQVTSSYIG